MPPESTQFHCSCILKPARPHRPKGDSWDCLRGCSAVGGGTNQVGEETACLLTYLVCASGAGGELLPHFANIVEMWQEFAAAGLAIPPPCLVSFAVALNKTMAKLLAGRELLPELPPELPPECAGGVRKSFEQTQRSSEQKRLEHFRPHVFFGFLGWP